VYLSFRDALEVSIPRTAESLYAWSERIPETQVQAGDLLFFKTTGAGTISHVGIYAGEGRFIHAASSGPKTGVIYSYLSDDYWRRSFAGSSRVLPVDNDLPFSDPLNPGGGIGAQGIASDRGHTADGDRAASEGHTVKRDNVPTGENVQTREDAPKRDKALPGDLLLGFGIAPIWGAVPGQSFPIRGTMFQFRFAWDIPIKKFHFRPGLELRPEWDSLLGIFRFPLTLSLGWSDYIRIFLGPALTLGDPVMAGSGEERRYTGGNSWLGIVGITATPFSVKAGNGILSLYGEMVWQSFFRDQTYSADIRADINAALKFSTGLRYTWEL
jgi:probable lipoprotein NlpC